MKKVNMKHIDWGFYFKLTITSPAWILCLCLIVMFGGISVLSETIGEGCAKAFDWITK